MSTYMDYERVGKLYDEARVADGVDMMCKTLTALTGKSMCHMDVLDAGCGTGNYSIAFLQHGLKSLKMVDASAAMLENARRKTEQYKNFVEIHQMTLPKLSFGDEQFDAVTFIQVLHHIDSAAFDLEKDLTKDDYPNMRESFKEAFRVLRPGGVLMVDTMFDENIDSFWWTSLCPKACKLMKRMRIQKQCLFEMLTEINFTNITFVMRPNACLLKREIYDQIGNIGDAHWRSYLSQYKLVEKTGELDSLIATIQSKVDDGSLPDFFYELNSNLRIYGNHVTVFAEKAS